MLNIISIFSSVLLLLLASPAHAEFIVSEMIVDFGEKSPRQHDLEVVSHDKETQYIATETYVIENPGSEKEKRTLFTDPQKSGLMITPNKLVLPAGSRKMIRMLLLKPQGETDQVYRVVIKPVIQGVEADKQLMALKVLVGYETVVIVRPKDAKYELVAERKGNSLTLTNKGNTNANLQSGQQCDATGSNCKELNVGRVYAGQSWTTTLPHMDGAAKYQVWDGTNMKDMSF